MAHRWVVRARQWAIDGSSALVSAHQPGLGSLLRVGDGGCSPPVKRRISPRRSGAHADEVSSSAPSNGAAQSTCTHRA